MGPASASARDRGPLSAWTFSKPGGCDGRPVGGGGGAGVCRVRRSRHSRRGPRGRRPLPHRSGHPQRRGATRNGRAIGPAAARRSPRPACHRQRISTWRTLIAFSKAQSAPTLLVRLPMRHASSASSQASSSSLSSSIESATGCHGLRGRPVRYGQCCRLLSALMKAGPALELGGAVAVLCAG